MKKSSDISLIDSEAHFKQIETQERKSSELWRKTDSPTSPTERKENMWKRVTNRVKTDEEG